MFNKISSTASNLSVALPILGMAGYGGVKGLRETLKSGDNPSKYFFANNNMLVGAARYGLAGALATGLASAASSRSSSSDIAKAAIFAGTLGLSLPAASYLLGLVPSLKFTGAKRNLDAYNDYKGPDLNDLKKYLQQQDYTHNFSIED